MNLSYKLCIVLCGLVFTGCASVHAPLSTLYVPLDTVSSSVNLTIRSSEQSMTGSGYLVYQYPDKAHVIVLSPFGTVLFEAYAIGENIVLVYPSEKTAFTGHFDELPEKGNLQGWKLIHWVMSDAFNLHNISQKQSLTGNTSRKDLSDKITIEKNLILSKERKNGDKVYYAQYSSVNGVLLAHELDVRNTKDDQLRIVLEDPEVNIPLGNSAFIPRIDGYKIYPIKSLEQ